MKVVGSVAGDLPQCFQLRRPRKRLAVRMHGSADVRMCGRWAEDRPLTISLSHLRFDASRRERDPFYFHPLSFRHRRVVPSGSYPTSFQRGREVTLSLAGVLLYFGGRKAVICLRFEGKGGPLPLLSSVCISKEKEGSSPSPAMCFDDFPSSVVRDVYFNRSCMTEIPNIIISDVSLMLSIYLSKLL